MGKPIRKNIKRFAGKNRKPKRNKKIKNSVLRGNPQVKGVVTECTSVNPKKPNSANRKILKVRLNSGKEVFCYIPGEQNSEKISVNNVVLIRGGGPKDCGIHYSVVIGALDSRPSNKPRFNGASRYGQSAKQNREKRQEAK